MGIPEGGMRPLPLVPRRFFKDEQLEAQGLSKSLPGKVYTDNFPMRYGDRPVFDKNGTQHGCRDIPQGDRVSVYDGAGHLKPATVVGDLSDSYSNGVPVVLDDGPFKKTRVPLSRVFGSLEQTLAGSPVWIQATHSNNEIMGTSVPALNHLCEGGGAAFITLADPNVVCIKTPEETKQ